MTGMRRMRCRMRVMRRKSCSRRVMRGDADQDEGEEAHQDEGEAHQDEEAYEPEEEDEELGCGAGAVPKVYIRGPARLPDRPIPLANRPVIKPEGLR
jgi:hypothetical protein